MDEQGLTKRLRTAGELAAIESRLLKDKYAN